MQLYGSPQNFFLNINRHKAFIRKCHEGFSLAQNEIVRLLPDTEAKIPLLLEDYRKEIDRFKKDRVPPIPIYTKAGIAYFNQVFEARLLREIANCIAWQLVGDDGTKIRALIQGIHTPPAQRIQLEKMLDIVNELNGYDVESFGLLTDITSCIQVADVLVRLSTGQIGLSELKEGKVNDHIETLLKMEPHEEATHKKFDELATEYGKPFIKQFKRVVRQKERMQKVTDYVNKSVGDDIQFAARRITNAIPISTDNYIKEVNLLMHATEEKGAQYLAIDDCLVLGAFDNTKPQRSKGVCRKDFQHIVWHKYFEDWETCAYGKTSGEEAVMKHFEYMLLPVWEMRDKVATPTHRPIFISGLDKELVLDILFERKSLFFYFSPERFVSLCQAKGADVSWVTGKEYNRIKGKYSKAMGLFDIHDGIIKIKDDGLDLEMHMCIGTLFKLIYEFQRPAALADVYKNHLKEMVKPTADAP